MNARIQSSLFSLYFAISAMGLFFANSIEAQTNISMDDGTTKGLLVTLVVENNTNVTWTLTSESSANIWTSVAGNYQTITPGANVILMYKRGDQIAHITKTLNYVNMQRSGSNLQINFDVDYNYNNFAETLYAAAQSSQKTLIPTRYTASITTPNSGSNYGPNDNLIRETTETRTSWDMTTSAYVINSFKSSHSTYAPDAGALLFVAIDGNHNPTGTHQITVTFNNVTKNQAEVPTLASEIYNNLSADLINLLTTSGSGAPYSYQYSPTAKTLSFSFWQDFDNVN